MSDEFYDEPGFMTGRKESGACVRQLALAIGDQMEALDAMYCRTLTLVSVFFRHTTTNSINVCFFVQNMLEHWSN